VASNSVPVAIGSRRIFAVPLDLAYRNLDVDAMAYARFAPQTDIPVKCIVGPFPASSGTIRGRVSKVKACLETARGTILTPCFAIFT
jgi:hypothetical protein